MYIDFHKYNYELIPESDRARYIARDKEAYKTALQKWFNDNVDAIVERKWELEEIFFIKEYVGFSGILKESENLFELGLFTSCIALACIVAEDFSRFLSIKAGNADLLDLSQFERLKEMLSRKIIVQDTYDKLDDIRTIRNDVLHYNEGFKLKSDEELKVDAFRVLTDLRRILQIHLGIKKGQMSSDDFIAIQMDLIEGLLTKSEYRGFIEMQFRLRNAVSQLFDIDLAFDPDVNELVRDGIFEVLSEDFKDDVDLVDLNSNFPVCVDFDEKSKKMFKDLDIKKNDRLYAVIYSEIDSNGQSSCWKFINFRKV